MVGAPCGVPITDYAGKHTALGHLVGVTVAEAVGWGVAAWLELPPVAAPRARVVSAGSVVLIGGGTRARARAASRSRGRIALGARRVFVATGRAFDGEMGTSHRAAPRRAWRRLHDRRGPARARARAAREPPASDVVLVDCPDALAVESSSCAATTSGRSRAAWPISARCSRRETWHVVVVTNEVGLGIVPDNTLARDVPATSPDAHQEIAAIADEVYVAILGSVLRLRPSPVEMVAP